VIELTEPQIWTVIGVMAATLGVLVTIVTQSFNRTMNAKFETVTAGMNAQFKAMDAKIGAMDAKFEMKFDGLRTEMVLRFEQVDTRLERLEARVDGLDRDMQSVVKRVFPGE